MKNRRFGRREVDGDQPREYVSRDRRRGFSERRIADRREEEKYVAVERRRGKIRRTAERRAKRLKSAPAKELDRQVLQQTEGIPLYAGKTRHSSSLRLKNVKNYMYAKIMAAMDRDDIAGLSGDSMRSQLIDVIVAELEKESIPVSGTEQRELIDMLVDDIAGFGPLEPLLADHAVSDVMVNGPDRVWIERQGKIELTDVTFDSATHLLNVIARILSQVNRRVDESCPMIDARLPDGNRINVIIPPLSYRFPSVSIRKFVEQRMTLDHMVAKETLSADMAMLLQLMTKFRLNILISGGAGVGKTTLLNALSRHINPRERIVTIEDTAELQLQQPNVVSLESGVQDVETLGRVGIGDLLFNALRMRPDRILVGEVRGVEASNMLQAMNTGHDGSIGTIHSNSPRDALMRFENMVCMSDEYVPGKVTRQQIVSALDVVIQVSRMSDGARRVTCISEVVGMEGEVILTQDLYRFVTTRETDAGVLEGTFEMTPFRPAFFDKIKSFNMTAEERAFIDGSNQTPAAA